MSDPARFADYMDAIAGNRAVPEPFRIPETGLPMSPYSALRRSLPSAELRRLGTYFTGSALADAVWSRALSSLRSGAVVVDPACGAGDLLLPVAQHATRVGLHGLVIRGADVNDSFVDMARSRIGNAVAPHTARAEGVVADFLKSQDSIQDATHVVLNPPFITVPVESDWAQGSVNAAAAFVIAALESMHAGARLIALLPDVLRSGSRYERWRTVVTSYGRIASIQLHGQFDSDTDVHVFVLEVIVGETGPSPTWLHATMADSTVGDRFSVRVGAVVPHRALEEGPESIYVTARALAAGQQLWRRFGGRLDYGPLVLINRTSRPGQANRARARVHSASTALAIENHLLVAHPRDGSISSCVELVEVLEDPRTASFLDERIRCRHLTVGSIKEIPWLM